MPAQSTKNQGDTDMHCVNTTLYMYIEREREKINK